MAPPATLQLAASEPEAGLTLSLLGFEQGRGGAGDVLIEVGARSRGWTVRARVTWLSVGDLRAWLGRLETLDRELKGNAALDVPPCMLLSVSPLDAPGRFKANVWLSEAASAGEEPVSNRGQVEFRVETAGLHQFVIDFRHLLDSLRQEKR